MWADILFSQLDPMTIRSQDQKTSIWQARLYATSEKDLLNNVMPEV